MKTQEERYDVVVVGGGLSGFCAAMAAAREGAKTCLIHNRPVLGGNASSEVRVTVHGAACHHAYCRETGIVGEAMRLERSRNHLFPIENGWTNSVFDMSLYDMVMQEKNLTLHLNSDVYDVEMADGILGLDALSRWPAATDEKGYWLRPACHEGDEIRAVLARVQNAEVVIRAEGKVFVDCTGDALVGHLAGCEWRMGSESREETGEVHATPAASTDTMGNSIHIRCIDTGRPAPFKAPDWAIRYDDADFFYKQGRKPNEPQGGYWWLEIGVPWDTIHDNETIRHELTRHALGVWDWMKNKDPKMMDACRNFALEFIGQVPGKRESRRIIGCHFLNENELRDRQDFEDEVAFGGWFIDLHTPGGLLAEHSEPASAAGYDASIKDIALTYIGPYGIPLRSLISKDVPNLMMAGRNISVTHSALGTVRVMATCGLMGEAVGTAAAVGIPRGWQPGEVAERAPGEIQNRLLRNGCFLPHASLREPKMEGTAEASSSAEFSGIGAREKDPDRNLREHVWTRSHGHSTDLSVCPCNWFFMGDGPVDRLGAHLVSETGGVVTARLRRVEHIWVYDRDPGGVVWESEIELPAGGDEVVSFPVEGLAVEQGCYRLEIEGPEGNAWRLSGRHPWGVVGGLTVGSGRFHWNRLPGEHAFQISPAQAVYGPDQVLSGGHRPQARSNVWFADGALPQWVGVTWNEPRTLGEIVVTFPDQLILELHWENPFYVAPHIAKRYKVLARIGGEWKTVAVESENLQSRRVHDLGGLEADALRIQIEETHGGPAAVCSIRVSTGGGFLGRTDGA